MGSVAAPNDDDFNHGSPSLEHVTQQPINPTSTVTATAVNTNATAPLLSSSSQHAQSQVDHDEGDNNPSPPSTAPSSSDHSIGSHPDDLHGTATDSTASLTASSSLGHATPPDPMTSAAIANVAAAALAIMTEPPPGPQTAALPAAVTVPPPATIQQPPPPPAPPNPPHPPYQAMNWEKRRSSDGASAGSEDEKGKGCCGSKFNRAKWIGTISCTLAPCSCYSQGSGVLGNIACCLVWPVTTVAGLAWGTANCVTCSCCGLCG